MKDYRIATNEKTQDTLFKIFDQDGSGEINYDEFVKAVIGDMNQRRLAVVNAAFQKLDADQSGTLSSQEITQSFNSKAHPKVISGEITEDAALYGFIDTFNNFMISRTGDIRNTNVNLEDFVMYYNCVSCLEPNDSKFEQMVAQTWNLI